jgi:hypothetical protein
MARKCGPFYSVGVRAECTAVAQLLDITVAHKIHLKYRDRCREKAAVSIILQDDKKICPVFGLLYFFMLRHFIGPEAGKPLVFWKQGRH